MPLLQIISKSAFSFGDLNKRRKSGHRSRHLQFLRCFSVQRAKYPFASFSRSSFNDGTQEGGWQPCWLLWQDLCWIPRGLCSQRCVEKQSIDNLNNLSGESWLGLDNLHRLTSQHPYKLKIILTDWDGKKEVAVYDQFQVSQTIPKLPSRRST